MTSEQLLTDLFEGRWPPDRNIYSLNTALRLRPWWPPLPSVWWALEEGCPEGRGDAYTRAWPEAAALLRDLYAQYQAQAGSAA